MQIKDIIIQVNFNMQIRDLIIQVRDGQGIKLKYATFHLYLFVLNIY